jgi:hypothetical protein
MAKLSAAALRHRMRIDSQAEQRRCHQWIALGRRVWRCSICDAVLTRDVAGRVDSFVAGGAVLDRADTSVAVRTNTGEER